MNKGRLLTLALFLAGLFLSLGGKLYDIQIHKGSYYLAKAAARGELTENGAAHRGKIFVTDKNGATIPVATAKQFSSVFAVPTAIEDADEVAHALAPILGRTESDLLKLLNKTNDQYELLATKLPEETISTLKAADLPGIYLDDEPTRFYPYERLASHVVGFLGTDAKSSLLGGKYGIEAEKNIELADGSDIFLTLDRSIQSQAERTLKNTVEKFKASSGTVIVQEPKTGKILAMANAPDFDPNEYGDFPLKHFTNPAVQSIYEAGSVFKVLTMAAGLDAGVITPATTYTDTGSMTLNGKTFKNWDLKAHGRVSMTEVIEKSINTGAAFAESKIGHDRFYNYLVNFGFSELTNISLPGEVRSRITHLKKNIRDINFATASFGQGIAITPLALINAIGAIANGGTLMKPYIDANERPTPVRTVLSKEAAKAAAMMMVSAVDKAEVAAIRGYKIAGKTGTAQIPDPKTLGYSDEYIHTYVGFGPVDDPRFIILLKIERPNVTLAGGTVVPAFHELAQFILNYLNIPPDRPVR